MTHALRQLLRFAWLELQSCLFPIGVFAGLVLVRVVPLPIAGYDALLIWCLLSRRRRAGSTTSRASHT